MKTKLFTLLLLLLPVCIIAQDYEKEGDALFAQAQYEKAEKKYTAAIAILGETPALKAKQAKSSKCAHLLPKARAAESDGRYSDAAKFYSDLYANHPLSNYQSKAIAMKQKAEQAEQERLAKRQAEEKEKQARLAKEAAERKAEQERIAKEDAERKAEQERLAKIEARTYRWKFRNNISCKYFEGTLTISGEGKWEDFDYDYNPWGTFKDSVKSIIISENITNIANYAFHGFRMLTSVTISDGITKIGVCAFARCESLKTLTLPNSVRSIGESAFALSGLKSISIPYGVKYIRVRTFERCSLTSITLPNSVVYIGYEAFRDCSRLSSITLSNNLAEIEGCAFLYCRNLSSIFIPNSVQKINYEAFKGCPASITAPQKLEGIQALDRKNVTYY